MSKQNRQNVSTVNTGNVARAMAAAPLTSRPADNPKNATARDTIIANMLHENESQRTGTTPVTEHLDDDGEIVSTSENPFVKLFGPARFQLSSGKTYEDKRIAGKTSTDLAHAIFSLGGIDMSCAIRMESTPVNEADGTYYDRQIRLSLPRAFDVDRRNTSLVLAVDEWRDMIVAQYWAWAQTTGADKRAETTRAAGTLVLPRIKRPDGTDAVKPANGK